jgi:hypothetical protein
MIYLDEGGLILPLPLEPVPLARAKHVSLTGQCITLDRDSATEWVATGWRDGLPIHRKIISQELAASLISRCPDSVIT